MIFEDGEQRRDFVYVGDVARAFCDALTNPNAAGEVFNVGSGVDRSVRQVARSIARALGRDDLTPKIAGKARIGDIRHCFCDGSKAAEKLSFRAEKDFDEGLAELSEWVAQQSADDRVDQARAELEAKGLVA
jgi:dTDP-L-rhamnose 4-epimerase